VQGIYICTPPFARDGLEQAAIAKGIHLLVEKPVALDMEKVWTNAKLAEEAGIIHTSGYCLRYLDIVQEAKEYLKDKQVDLIIGDRIGGHPPATWWGKMALSGGQLVEQSTHQLDLIRYLAGEFEEVYGVFEQRHMKEIDPDADAY